MLKVKIKATRIQLSAILNVTKMLYGTGNREISLTLTCLQRSRMFLGQCLKEISPDTNPYPQSDNPNNANVEPAADIVSNNPLLSLMVDTRVKNTKTVRMLIQEEINKLRNIYRNNPPYSYFKSSMDITFYSSNFMTALDALTEAKMWLGVDMQNYYSGQTQPAYTKQEAADGVEQRTCQTKD